MNKTTIIAEEGKQELFIEREFEAPRELVFTAFNDPAYLVQWMGPDTMEMKIDYFNNHTGGAYRFVHKLCNANGNEMEFGFNGVMHEVTFPERMIRTFEFEGLPERGHVSLEFLTFESLAEGRCKLNIQAVFKSVADRDGLIKSGMERGMNQGFAKLDVLLQTQIKKV